MLGRGHIFMVFWIVLHAVAFALAAVNYGLKDNLNNARNTFGWTFSELKYAD